MIPPALSVRNPWAAAITHGLKLVENRVWSTPYRGPLLVHASARVDPAGTRWLADRDIAVPSVQSSAIVCVVDLVDIVTDSTSEWAIPGAYHWLLDNVRRLDEPVPMAGALGLFRTWTRRAVADDVARLLDLVEHEPDTLF